MAVRREGVSRRVHTALAVFPDHRHSYFVFPPARFRRHLERARHNRLELAAREGAGGVAAAPFVARAPREGDAADRLIVAVESSRREGYSLVKMDGHVARIYLDV